MGALEKFCHTFRDKVIKLLTLSKNLERKAFIINVYSFIVDSSSLCPGFFYQDLNLVSYNRSSPWAYAQNEMGF